MKKNLLSVLILALLIVNIILSTVMMVSVVSTNSKTAKLVTSIATVLNLEYNEPGEEAVADVPLSQTDTYDMPELTVLLAPSADGEAEGETGGEHYIVFDMTLAMDTKHKDYKNTAEYFDPATDEKLGNSETMAEYDMMIRSTAENVIASYTREECRSNLDEIKEEILKEIQDLFQSDFIYKVAISNVKYG